MGVQNVSGESLHVLVSASLAQSPHQRPPEAAQETAVPPKPQHPKPSEEQRQRVEQQRATAQPVVQGGGVRLHVDPRTDRIVAEILDADDNVIKQIPPEELLELVASMRAIQGLLFDQET